MNSAARYRFTMSKDELTDPVEDRAWVHARMIWSAAGVDLPERISGDIAYYLTDLKLVAAMFRSVDEVERADRSRKVRPKELAEYCRALSSPLSQIDTISLARLARATPRDVRETVNDTLVNLYFLEAVFETTEEPTIPRKRKHDVNDMAIPRLAEIFEDGAKANASVTKHWEGSNRSGRFVDFVLKFYELMLPEFAARVSGRSIQASLEKYRAGQAPDRG